eukprot:CAMPEP_0117571460 /NCGR_PEP_ID=MMETSP0784-20121206/59764_1 /TAXON_ID=39447 /ORGANISM="" /LENGTH=396 /DNA_ID=CAMNT_0005369623 /DNA_START=117 /DNA_END=1304 /DNA_ORIENTATION=-
MESRDGAVLTVVDCVESPAAGEIRSLLENREAPLLLRGALDWPALRWSGADGLAALGAEHGHRLVDVRFAPRHRGPSDAARTPWEGECCRMRGVALGDFCKWLAGEPLPAEHALAAFPVDLWWGYCGYQHFEELFADVEGANRAAADFSVLLGDALAPAGSAPTLWLGGSDARTPCHQDAYGCNLVAQLSGEKRWLLFPPTDAKHLVPQRLPYEDASTFTAHDPLRGSVPPGCSGFSAVLLPNDLLFVPRHWFHAVECTSPSSLSINQWFDAQEDAAERVREAVVRCIATPLLEDPPAQWWVNPDEELYDSCENVAYLVDALQRDLRPQEALSQDKVRAALLKAATHPEVVGAIVDRLAAEIGGGALGRPTSRCTALGPAEARLSGDGRWESHHAD